MKRASVLESSTLATVRTLLDGRRASCRCFDCQSSTPGRVHFAIRLSVASQTDWAAMSRSPAAVYATLATLAGRRDVGLAAEEERVD